MKLLLNALQTPVLSFEGPSSFAIYGSALAAVIATLWALLERSERRDSQRQRDELSLACRDLIETHSSERLKAEERHMLERDSSARHVLEHMERIVFGKPPR